MSNPLTNFDRLPNGLSLNLADALDSLASVAQDLSYIISKGDIGNEVQSQTSVNSDGDD